MNACSKRAAANAATEVVAAADRTTAQECKPLVDAARGWREDLRVAYQSTGHTQASIAAALDVSQQFVGRLLDSSLRAVLNLDHLEDLRDNAVSRDAWLVLLQRHAAAAGATLVEVRADEHSHLERLALLIRELGDVPRVYAEQLATDGVVDELEVDELDLQLREAGDAIARARVALRTRRRCG